MVIGENMFLVRIVDFYDIWKFPERKFPERQLN